MGSILRLAATPLGWLLLGPLLAWMCIVWCARFTLATIRWAGRHWRYSALCLLVTAVGQLTGAQQVREAGYSWLLFPAMVSALWSVMSPGTYSWVRERRIGMARTMVQPGVRLWLRFAWHVATEFAGFAVLSSLSAARWAWRHRAATISAVLAGGAVALLGGFVLLRWCGVAIALLPPLLGGAMETWSVHSYRASVREPWDRLMLLRWVSLHWGQLARESGLSVVRDDGTGPAWIHPQLVQLVSDGPLLTLVVRARIGQVPEDIERAVPAIESAVGASSARVRTVAPDAVEVVLTMLDLLEHVSVATIPAQAIPESVDLGRRQDGGRWRLSILGRHTLIVGCSGSGKGSVLWGICGGLAHAVARDEVRLWGVDLKRGVEMSMGSRMFTRVATEPVEALGVLARLRRVIDDRGREMAGVTRAHEPSPGNPLHVLVIDELAVLTAYAELDVRRDASRVLAEILTQGRALGVVVVACVQDPRKETVGLRNLFTQVVALRLRSAEETRMALGEGLPDNVKPHRIPASCPGMAWVVDDSGEADLVRADFWPDALVREVARQYGAAVQHDVVDVEHPPDAAPPKTRRLRQVRASLLDDGATP